MEVKCSRGVRSLKYIKTRVRDLTPLEHFTSIISRTIRGRSNMSMARTCASLRGTIN